MVTHNFLLKICATPPRSQAAAARTNLASRRFVRREGIGPSTSVLSGQRSTTELPAHLIHQAHYLPTIRTAFPARTTSRSGRAGTTELPALTGAIVAKNAPICYFSNGGDSATFVNNEDEGSMSSKKSILAGASKGRGRGSQKPGHGREKRLPTSSMIAAAADPSSHDNFGRKRYVHREHRA